MIPKSELLMKKFIECYHKLEHLKEQDRMIYLHRLDKMINELYDRMDLQTEFLTEMIHILNHHVHSRIKIVE